MAFQQVNGSRILDRKTWEYQLQKTQRTGKMTEETMRQVDTTTLLMVVKQKILLDLFGSIKSENAKHKSFKLITKDSIWENWRLETAQKIPINEIRLDYYVSIWLSVPRFTNSTYRNVPRSHTKW